MQRYFIEQKLEERIIIKDDEVIHHLKNVMHNKLLDVIVLVSNECAYTYKIVEIAEYISCQKVDIKLRNPELKIKVDFAVSFLKKDNFELALQKLVENGVNEIIPVDFKRSVVKLDSKKWSKKKLRYESILKSAAMQSQRNIIPQISDISSVSALKYDEYDLVLLCYELETQKLISQYDELIKSSKRILVIIGPEGGIEESEIDLIKDRCSVVSLGNRILRAETAIMSTMYYLSVIIQGA